MAIAANAYQVYRKQGVMTASPVELVIMLYDGCLRQLRAAKAGIENKNFEEANKAMQRAEDIVTELSSSLDCRFEISGHLMQIYDYVNRSLLEINTSKNAEENRRHNRADERAQGIVGKNKRLLLDCLFVRRMRI